MMRSRSKAASVLFKDWPLLEQAVEVKIEEQAELVKWWDKAVQRPGGDRQSEKHSSRTALMGVATAEELTGIIEYSGFVDMSGGSSDDAALGEVEAVKERLAEKLFEARSGCGAYIRNVTLEIASGRFSEPPAKERIGRMYWNQKDQAVLELGGHVEKLFLLWVVAAEQVYQQKPDVFGGVEDLAAHKAKIAELEAKRKELYARFPSTWAHSDLHIGRITSDGAALITFERAPDEVPAHPCDRG